MVRLFCLSTTSIAHLDFTRSFKVSNDTLFSENNNSDFVCDKLRIVTNVSSRFCM